MLDDIDPTSEWVAENHSVVSDPNIDDSGWIDLDIDPLVGVAIALGMASTSHVTGVSTSTTTTVADVLEESNELEDSEPKNSPLAHVDDHISNSGDEFDD